MKLFGRSKVTAEDLERQAAQELDSAVAQAKPPTEAERTWVLPLDEGFQVPPAPRRNLTRVRTGLLPPPEEEKDAEPPARPSRRTSSAAGSRRTARQPASARTGARSGGPKAASRARAASPKPAATSTAKTGR